MVRNKSQQRGQGMTEYIIIVALIAIAAIAVYSFFGGTIRGQVAAMSQELAGQEGDTSLAKDAATSAVKKANEKKEGTLENYTK